MVIGYTSGVFDLFHVGHVRLLRRAKGLCDWLIVGVTNDHLVSYKNKKAVIPFDERLEIVESCKFVDLAVEQISLDKLDAYRRYKFNVMFVGDDWYQTERWNEIETTLTCEGVRVVYFPYTRTTSSTLINRTLEELRRG